MRCSNCGQEGHNSRTCPNEKREKYAVWTKFDNLESQTQANDLLNAIKKAKIQIAPNARGTAATAKEKDLPIEIKNVLQIGGGKSGDQEE